MSGPHQPHGARWRSAGQHGAAAHQAGAHLPPVRSWAWLAFSALDQFDRNTAAGAAVEMSCAAIQVLASGSFRAAKSIGT